MRQRQVESIAILAPKGYLTGGDETDELERTIKQLGESGNKHLIVNLADTQHLNSTALGVLISAHTNYVRRGGQMKLCFDVYPSEEQAIASFAEPKSV